MAHKIAHTNTCKTKSYTEDVAGIALLAIRDRTRVVFRQTQTKAIAMKKSWVALFRGINVGGKNIVPMRELVEELTSLKLENVRTYIQSGNAVFEADSKTTKSLPESIAERIERRYAFRPKVLVISGEELQAALEANPFPEAATDPKSLHFFFLDKPPTKPNLTALNLARSASENFATKGSVFYLHAPDGVGRSKLAASVEKHLGVTATARNYRTVEKLIALVTAASS